MLPKNLKYLRTTEGKSQQFIADQVNVSRAVYQRHESGKNEPPYAVLISICDHYGVTLDEILLNDIEKDEKEDAALMRGEDDTPVPITDQYSDNFLYRDANPT